MKDRLTKKQLSVSMYDRGMNVVAIARLLRCEPSYVANSLIDQGRLPAYEEGSNALSIQRIGIPGLHP
mgnify:CR=1 FL=1